MTFTPDLVLAIDDFQFSEFEIPASIGGGTRQTLVRHRIPGSDPIIDSTGRDPMPLRWSGILTGANAELRAQTLDGMASAGGQRTVTWRERRYDAVIAEFSWQWERHYRIGYSIELQVVRDQSQPPGAQALASVDAAVAADLASATTLSAQVKDTPLSQATAALDTAIKAVSSVATAVQSEIAAILAPVQEIKSRCDTLLAATANTLSNIASVGGLIPQNPLAAKVADFNAKLAAADQASALSGLRDAVSRIGVNVTLLSTDGQTQTVANTSLFKLAADAYGDASKWTKIATANRLNDPRVTDARTVQVPR